MSAETPSARRRRLLTSAGLFALVVVGLAGIYMFRVWWGSPVGGKCDESRDCKPGLGCISDRCYRECAADSDCEAGWTCHPTDVTVSRVLSKDESKQVKICFAPE
jgi:hypothetical protein